MIARAVLSVLLAVALLGVTSPALENARIERSTTETVGELDVFRDTVKRFVLTEEPVDSAHPGARLVVRLRLPLRTWTSAGIDYVALGSVPGTSIDHDGNGSDVLAFAIENGPEHVIRVPGIDIRVPAGKNGQWFAGDGTGIVLRSGGTHQIVLRLISIDGRPIVALELRDRI